MAGSLAACLPPSLSNSLPCPDLHEITGDSVFVYTSLLDMTISENTLADPFEQSPSEMISEHRVNLPDARSTGMLVPSTTKQNRRRVRAVNLSMNVLQKTNLNTDELILHMLSTRFCSLKKNLCWLCQASPACV